MTKKQKLQNEIAYDHIAKIAATAKLLRSRRITQQGRSIPLDKSLKIAKRYHRIFGF